ncbi:hypothetical protein SAMN05421854_114126 [Amycolatopsis rubida]|uniref:Uncharacterized protein n=1 Tax=Amycolatopsis rubida TaxID=112413 RepID=A0A1I5ZA41_9PSEU|nr:hypothetical protein SAMN05421854_114126 [Amycolatopsis rubida]
MTVRLDWAGAGRGGRSGSVATARRGKFGRCGEWWRGQWRWAVVAWAVVVGSGGGASSGGGGAGRGELGGRARMVGCCSGGRSRGRAAADAVGPVGAAEGEARRRSGGCVMVLGGLAGCGSAAWRGAGMLRGGCGNAAWPSASPLPRRWRECCVAVARVLRGGCGSAVWPSASPLPRRWRECCVAVAGTALGGSAVEGLGHRGVVEALNGWPVAWRKCRATAVGSASRCCVGWSSGTAKVL